MARQVSLRALTATLAEETGDAWAILLTITHPTLSTPFRITSYGVTVTSRGLTFLPFWFDVAFPDELAGEFAATELTLDAVDVSVLAALRAAGTTRPLVSIEMVLAGQPDTVEMSAPDLELSTFQFVADRIVAQLTPPEVLNVRYPGERYVRSTWPTLSR